MNARKVIELYWEHGKPRIGRIGPKGYDRRGEQKGNIRFYAWLRVVTEPRYPEFEKDLKAGIFQEFEDILTESLKLIPFSMPQDLNEPDIRGAFIPVSAATIYAGAHKVTIHRWIARGLKHEKRGPYYWVSVMDLERFFTRKRRQKPGRNAKLVEVEMEAA